MRTLAIDLGTRRVGLAISDEGGRFATPLDVIEVNAPDQAIEPIVALCGKEAVQRIVVGLPLEMNDGAIGPAARSVVLWSGRLARKIVIPILYVDERLSSFQAQQDLIAQKRSGGRLTREMKKQRLDAKAAAVFLQEFLDGKLQAVDLG